MDKKQPSKRGTPLCSITALPIETGCFTAAHLSEAFGRKVQPAAATKSKTERDYVRQTEPKRDYCPHVSFPSNSDHLESRLVSGKRGLYRFGSCIVFVSLALWY